MDAVIGLGSAGCNIADHFSKYPQYKDLMDDLINILNRYDAIDRI